MAEILCKKCWLRLPAEKFSTKKRHSNYCIECNIRKGVNFSAKSRSRLYGRGNFVEIVSFSKLYELYNGKCFYCEQGVSIEEAVADHYIPLSKRGKHSTDNLRLSCRYCNNYKGDKTPEEFEPFAKSIRERGAKLVIGKLPEPIKKVSGRPRKAPEKKPLLNVYQVAEIRELCRAGEMTYEAIASIYGTTKQNISLIARNETHIKV